MKYLKITLVLFTICLVCALGVAGVNMFTSPIIEEYQNEQKLAAYRELFPDMSGDSEVIESGFGSSYIQERINAVDEDGNVLGYGFVVSGSNQYGVITLVVAIDENGSLMGISCTENGQTGGRADMINTYLGSFTSGMTVADVNNLANYSGATYGSRLVKNLINAAYTELNIEIPDAPVIEGYDVYYQELFDNVSIANSVVREEVKGENILEAKDLYDADGNLLGHGFVATSTNSLDGVLTLCVGVNTNGTLAKVVDIEIAQTGGSPMGEYHNSFTNGMVASDIDNVSAISGATVGSDQYKALLKECLSEIVSYVPYYQNVFGEGITLTPVTELNRDSIIEANKVTKDNQDLGYGYVIRLENPYGYNVMFVGLNSNGTFKQLVDIENNHADLTEIATVFEDGSNMAQIITQGNSDKAIEIGASYTSEIATLGIKIAMDANSNSLTESVSDELNIKELFPYAVYRRCNELTITNTSNITKAYEVYGVANYQANQLLGYMYYVTVENNDIKMTLAVGVDSNHNYIGSIMLSYETKVVINISGSFSDTLQSRVVSYLASLEGMSDSQIRVASLSETMSYASILVKETLRLAINESNKEAYTMGNLYNHAQVYLNAIPNIDLLNATPITNLIYDDTISALSLVDGSKVYIIENINVYSHNYILVQISQDGKLMLVYDVENNHGGISNKLEAGMTLDDVENIEFAAGGSFTYDQTRQAVLVAFDEFNNGTNTLAISREMAIKELYPFVVYGRNNELTPVDTINILYSVDVYGVAYYQTGQRLGLAFEVELSQSRVMISVNLAGEYTGYYAYDVITAEEKAFLDSLDASTEVVDLAYVNSLTDTSGAKEKVVAVLTEASHYMLTAYDTYIKGVFSDYDYTTSTLIDSFSSDAFITGVNVKNKDNTDLGYAYVIYLENAYGYNYMLVTLNSNGTFKSLVDIENNHADLTDMSALYTDGMTIEQVIEAGNSDKAHEVGASFTCEIATLGIKLAMNEVATTKTSNYAYEQYAKEVFPYMVLTHSSELANLTDVTYAYHVYGTANYQNNQELGYFFIITKENRFGTITLGVGIDNEGKLVGIKAIAVNQTGGRKPTVEAYIETFTAGMTAEEVALKDVQAGATYGSNTVKEILALAFSTYQSIKEGGNN